ncbi:MULTISPECIES: sensor histidine kinase [Xanthomonas]|uniref:sensor histidine kinase n=2 Tax=Xanthomonas TaxID=338 RepID=UPI001AD99C2D|nr:ATP-binding protein [Xanthomonas phaseoli]MBO9769990.1 HAMP domain-containing histidine kinase [Xanthomonas phaseoli pv. dieffenbachiae]MBO9778138.1 HAMP domain-containing histidine kinase [Xanthomonas phaseoli pv. dieffenbachiae]MBO9782056.1 HAMP domain-containing histidine kinase [Xanthomonas phaseoli pv. dieffenbachiae]MBO9798358.1 HAMP domain-containing histidine kinase [Xanthomonas phaseoli pv. dieffenbachiae]MBO9802326.1 HAMP domain-containing histidine kinase [Xanthomonas phaseoli pv
MRKLRRWLMAHRNAPLSLWIGMRISGLAITTVCLIAFSMWTYFNIRDYLILRDVPPDVQAEIQLLRAQPDVNEARLWQLLERYYDIHLVLPRMSNPDWVVLSSMVVVFIPLILLCGLLIARPLSRQLLHVARVAHRVSEGQFGGSVPVVDGAPRELTGLAVDFNGMSSKLQQYERELRESSAMLAHELRTPLTAAMGRVQGMLDEVFPRAPEQLALVHAQLEQINRLVSELHLVSLARAGQLVLEIDNFSLTDLINERLEWATPALSRAGMAISCNIPSDLDVPGDRARLGQVVSILIDNAIRYGSSGQVLELSVAAEPELYHILVGDRGPGVDPGDLPRLMDRFWRAEHSRARQSGGSGLGLAIASAICQTHGGQLSFSNRDGGGLLAAIQLPRKAIPPQSDGR